MLRRDFGADDGASQLHLTFDFDAVGASRMIEILDLTRPRNVFAALRRGDRVPDVPVVEIDDNPASSFIYEAGHLTGTAELHPNMKAFMEQHCYVLRHFSPYAEYPWYVPRADYDCLDADATSYSWKNEDTGEHGAPIRKVLRQSAIGEAPIFVLTSYPMTIYVSETFVELYRQTNSSGLEFIPAPVSE